MTIRKGSSQKCKRISRGAMETKVLEVRNAGRKSIVCDETMQTSVTVVCAYILLVIGIVHTNTKY